jgi:hypothetical protein
VISHRNSEREKLIANSKRHNLADSIIAMLYVERERERVQMHENNWSLCEKERECRYIKTKRVQARKRERERERVQMHENKRSICSNENCKRSICSNGATWTRYTYINNMPATEQIYAH